MARRYAGQFGTTLASVTIWLATPLVFYMFVQMPWSHATGFFLVALFLTIWQRTRGADERPTTTQTRRQGDKETRRRNNRQSPIPNPQSPIPNPQSTRSWRAWVALGIVGGLMTM